MALHADARLTQQSELIDSLHQQLQKRIEATEGFLAQMRQLDEANYTRPAEDK